ncbi:TetR/AcrR family transcriptional regulator [Nocardia yunnanensis]|uniref:TetR/AcrR family transcriptional regulator n=1 Tax=Nocardia yunnanensis TaxID=2382165 RepID=A0A386ZP39_9NOCA|nr:TetR/AcrR family transcriptional regulator [Nocardia yunnanensis]AYF79421.1 TetR/AcrR family transcriptional regulator [Nocardia yunnanensis]
MIRQAERSESTRATLIAAARELFAERGYAAVGTPEIVERAGSSRGALYHQFKDKKDLFRAVYEQVQQEILQQVGETMAAAPPTDALAALEAGLHNFLLSCVDTERVRIALIDAPSVLGWQEWREVDEKYGLGLVVGGLQAGIEAGVLRADLDIRPLSLIILSALGEAAMFIANADDPETARAHTEPVVLALINGLRV